MPLFQMNIHDGHAKISGDQPHLFCIPGLRAFQIGSLKGVSTPKRLAMTAHVYDAAARRNAPYIALVVLLPTLDKWEPHRTRCLVDMNIVTEMSRDPMSVGESQRAAPIPNMDCGVRARFLRQFLNITGKYWGGREISAISAQRRVAISKHHPIKKNHQLACGEFHKLTWYGLLP